MAHQTTIMKKISFIIALFSLVGAALLTGCQKQDAASTPATPATNAPATNAPAQ
jgi:uncharacterized lipoprotein YajG